MLVAVIQTVTLVYNLRSRCASSSFFFSDPVNTDCVTIHTFRITRRFKKYLTQFKFTLYKIYNIYPSLKVL